MARPAGFAYTKAVAVAARWTRTAQATVGLSPAVFCAGGAFRATSPGLRSSPRARASRVAVKQAVGVTGLAATVPTDGQAQQVRRLVALRSGRGIDPGRAGASTRDVGSGVLADFEDQPPTRQYPGFV